MHAAADSSTALGLLDDLFAKDAWTNEDVQKLYQALSVARSAQDRFHALASRLMRDSGEPAGAAAVKLGIVQYLTGDIETAAKTLAAGTDNKDRRYYQALCYKQLGQYDKAAEEFARAGDRGWDEAEVKLSVAECQVLAGDADAADKSLEKLAKLADRSQYHVVRGLVEQARGNQDEAEEAYGEALDRDPNDSEAAFRLAFLYDMYGDETQAVELYSQCLRNPPVSSHALINLAVLYEDAAQWDLAERCLQTLLAMRPTHPRARLYLKDIRSSRNMYYDEDQERRATQRNAVLDIPVTDFELSVRARNCLKKMEIRCLGDLLKVTEADLLAYKNFGETSLAEIKAMLTQKGLRLGQDIENQQPILARPAPTPTATVDNEGVLGTPVSELELSVRSRKALQRLNIASIGELASHTETELMACKNFGQTSLNEIKQRLAEYGLGLRDRR